MNKEFERLKKLGMIKNRVNVGILPEQVLEIKELKVKEGFESINQFVILSVEKELKKRRKK